MILPKLIYDNGASIPGRGMAHARKRFEVHLHKYFTEHRSNNGYILLGDFQKFYDNILHEKVKEMFLDLVNHDSYLEWLLDVILNNFRVDVSYMTDDEYEDCLLDIFNKNTYRELVKKQDRTGEKFMNKSINIGDQFSQVAGIYYLNSVDTYIKYVRRVKYYGRYMDDFYIIHTDMEYLKELRDEIARKALDLGIHLNMKKTRIVKLSSGYRYLQVKYILTSTGHIIKQINPKRVTAMRHRLKKLAMKVDVDEIDYNMVEEMFRSWMCNFYKLMSKEQREGLLDLYGSLFNKKIIFKKKSGLTKMVFIDQ